ncbi:MAG: SDR family NAD(P)-dependent oxidoreductase [Chitinophagales bacterium]
MKKILVTGGSGFLGAEIVKQLIQKGYKVKALKRSNSDTSFLKDYEGKFEWVTGDVLDISSLENAMQDVSQVYHTAAMISFSPSEKYKMFKINIEGTANVVNTALLKKVDKLLYVSSITSFGTYQFKEPISEEIKWKEHPDNTNYAVSKHHAELEVWRGKEEGLEVLIVNPSTILGKGNWNNGSLQIFKQVHDGIPFYPKGSMGFVGVADVAKASILLMDSTNKNEKFILNAENIKFKKLFEMIAGEFGVKAPQKELSKFIQEIGWRYYWLKSKLTGEQPMITKKTTQFTQWDFNFSNQKIKDAIGFEFEPIEKVVEKACGEFKQY